MNSSQEQPYSYSHLFAVVFSFSALASGIFMIYSLLRADSSLFLESPFVALVLLAVFSGTGEKISKVRNVGIWIVSVSMATMIISHSIVNSSDAILTGDWQAFCLGISMFTMIAFIFGPLFWILSEGSYYYIRRKGISRSALLAVAIGVSAVIAVYVAMISISQIMSFLDTHPWIVGLLVPLILFLAGVIYGRRTKKNKI